MAVIRGEQGSVHFDATGADDPAGSGTSDANKIVGTRSWTLNITKETLDTSIHGDTFRTFTGSMISGSGTVELVYDKTATGQTAFIEDVIQTSNIPDATFELFTTGNSSGTDSLSFKGILTSMDIASTSGDLVVATCNFITSGVITSIL